MNRHRPRAPRFAPILLCLASLTAVLSATPQETTPQPDTGKPIKVYILAGQSNMLEMGDISGRNTRHSGFYQSVDGDKGVSVSVYTGAYDPATDYDQLEPVATKTVIYDGMGRDPFPKVDGDVTYVARGFIEVPETGVYALSPGYSGSTYNVTELNGSQVYRREPGGDPRHTNVPMEGGRRYAFRTTFFTRHADGLFWVRRTDIPGTLERLVGEQGKFPYLRDDAGRWRTRGDVTFLDARLNGGWGWRPDNENELLLNEDKLKAAGRPLTVEKGVWVGLPFGFMLGDHHDEHVLIIRTAIGNRGLAWDFRPPSSGKLPDIKADLKKWEGAEYRMMVEGVRATLKHLGTVVPDHASQGFDLAGFVWFQGHKDTGNEQWAASYEANLKNLIKDVRSAFEAPQLPVVIASVGFGGHQMEGNTQLIWQAQMALGDGQRHPRLAGTVVSVDTRDFWRSPDLSPRNQGYHYNRNAETYMLIGEAMARSMIGLIGDNR